MKKCLLLLALVPTTPFAVELPKMEDPSGGTGDGILQALKNYGYDIMMPVVVLVVASMFIGVCYHAYTT